MRPGPDQMRRDNGKIDRHDTRLSTLVDALLDPARNLSRTARKITRKETRTLAAFERT